MKSSELLRILQKDGWFIIRQSGSHIMMRHQIKAGVISMPFHASAEVKKGLLSAILKKADIKKVAAAFPEYEMVGVSAREGHNMEEFYESLFQLSKKV